MKTTIDKAGRMVIPKAIRDMAGLQAGDELEITVRSGQIEIAPAEGPPGRIVYKNGLPYWEAPAEAGITQEQIREAIRQMREERKQF